MDPHADTQLMMPRAVQFNLLAGGPAILLPRYRYLDMDRSDPKVPRVGACSLTQRALQGSMLGGLRWQRGSARCVQPQGRRLPACLRGMSLAGQVAIVTGGGDGIGGATARRLAQEGASVLIVEISAQLGEENAAAIRAASGSAEAVVLDVSNGADIKRMVEMAVEKFGKLTLLVNNAYGARRDLPTPAQSDLGDKPGTKLPNSSKGSAVDLTEEGWDYAFDIGLKSHFLAAKYAVPHMAEAGGGSIVNISSVHGILSARNNLAYSSLKAGANIRLCQVKSTY